MRPLRLVSAPAQRFRGGRPGRSACARTMKIAEIFYSIQGEGMLAGVPSVFVRTSGCNLRCTCCDTPYASWEPEGDDLPIVGILVDVRLRRAIHVVGTGGGHMIQDEIVRLKERLKELGLHITIETAGTVYQPVI